MILKNIGYRTVSHHTKFQIFDSCETWKTTVRYVKKFFIIIIGCIRKILRILRTEKVGNKIVS